MYKGQQVREEIKAKKEIADLDRKQREKESKRGLVGSLVKGPIEAVAKTIFPQTKLNDASFYNGVLLKEKVSDESSVPTFLRSGNPQKFPSDSTYSSGVTFNRGVPSVLALRYCRTTGSNTTDDGTALAAEETPFTVAMARMISAMRTTTGREIKYSPDELGLWLISADELKVSIKRLGTAIQIAKLYQPENATYPVSLLMGWLRCSEAEAMSFIDDLQLWEKTYITVSSNFNANIPLPADLGIVKRTSWLSETVVADRNTRKKQVYMFVPNGILNFNPSDESELIVTAHLGYSSTMPTRAQYRAAVLKAINNLTLNISFTQLLTDIRAAFEHFVQIDASSQFIDTPYSILCLDEVLEQIHNLNTPMLAVKGSISTMGDCRALEITSGNAGLSSYKIKSDGDFVSTDIQIECCSSRAFTSISAQKAMLQVFLGSRTCVDHRNVSQGVSYVDTIIDRGLNFYKDEISNDDMITSTRLVSWWKYSLKNAPTVESQNNYVIASLAVCGTEVITSLAVYYATINSQTNSMAYTFEHQATDMTYGWGSGSFSGDAIIYCVADISSHFDWLPMRYYSGHVASNTAPQYNYCTIGESANYFEYPVTSASLVHDMCLLGEFVLPFDAFHR
jgi:hypothetical protein